MKYIEDSPCDLVNRDFLDGKTYSEVLEDALNSSPKNKSITIGLFGEWGTGKSSIIETTMNKLKESKIKFITYDAWKYSGDSFRRTFLIQIQKEVNSKDIKKQDLENNLYRNITKSKYDSKFALIGIGIFLFTLILLSIVEHIADDFNLSSILIVSLLGSIIPILLGFKNQIISIISSEKSGQDPYYFSPEQFEEDFGTMMKEELNKRGTEKIIIVIDNIDRCPQKQAYQLLTDVKGFLDGKDFNVIFLIPVADNSLREQIKKYGDNSSEFLRKIFDMVIHVKPLKIEDIFDFTNELKKEYDLNLKDKTTDLIAKEYATNPRRIIQLLNNLQMELLHFEKYYGKDFSKENEETICQLLIIKEEWPDFYRKLTHTPERLFEKTLQGLNQNTEEENDDESLIIFLQNTVEITNKVNASIIEKIISSREPFWIPENIRIDLKNRNYESVYEYIENDENFDLLTRYLYWNLKREAHENGSKEMSGQYLDHLLKINTVKKISSRINESIKKLIMTKYWSTRNCFENIKNLDEFILYVYDLREDHPELEESVTADLFRTNRPNGTEDFYKNLIIRFINNYPENSFCEKIQYEFSREYENMLGYDYDLENGEVIKSEKVQYLASSHLVHHLIGHTEKHDRNPTNMKNLTFISKNTKFTEEDIKKLVEKLHSLYPDHKGYSDRYYAGSEDVKNYTKQLSINLKNDGHDISKYDFLKMHQ